MRSRTDEVDQLNTFLHAITGKIPIGAVVLDSDFIVHVWNEQAAEMWGLRADEVIGQPFFSLDIGLPIKDLRELLRSVGKGKPPTDQVVVEAVNRRGRSVRCRVTASALPGGRETGGLVMLIEELKGENGRLAD